MTILLFIHIVAGSVAVLALPPVMFSRKGATTHRLAGRTYAGAMSVTLAVAFWLSFLLPSFFLGTIALFTAYQIATGLRLAIVREGSMAPRERVLAGLAIGNGAAMIGYGAIQWHAGDMLGVVMIVLGALSLGLGARDLFRRSWPAGNERIVLHLSRMGGSSIATLTAVTVVNSPAGIHPVWLPWLLPTIIGSPIIAWATAKRLRPTEKSKGAGVISPQRKSRA